MKHACSLFVVLACLFSFSAAQDTWSVVWRLTQLPNLPAQTGSELAIVKAGFDTDQDGWGEFLCAWTDLSDNYILMYEASADNTYDLVWSWKYPYDASRANTFAGIAVGDIDNNSKVDIVTTMPARLIPTGSGCSNGAAYRGKTNTATRSVEKFYRLPPGT